MATNPRINTFNKTVIGPVSNPFVGNNYNKFENTAVFQTGNAVNLNVKSVLNIPTINLSITNLDIDLSQVGSIRYNQTSNELQVNNGYDWNTISGTSSDLDYLDSSLIETESLIVSGSAILGNFTIASILKINLIESDEIIIYNSLFSEDQTFLKHLTVQNQSYFRSDINLSGNLNMNGNFFTNSINVSNLSFFNNNAFFASQLTVSNNVFFNSNLQVIGDLEIENKLIINNDIIQLNNYTDILNDCSVSNLNIKKDLIVSGNTLIYSNLNIKANTYIGSSLNIDSNLYLSGNSYINSNLIVSGTFENLNETFLNKLYVQNDSIVSGNLNVSNCYINHDTIIGNDLDIRNNLTVDNYIIGNSSLLILDNVFFKKNLEVNNNTFFLSNVDISNNLNVNKTVIIGDSLSILNSVNTTDLNVINDIKVSADLEIGNTLTVSGISLFLNTVNINNDLIISSKLTIDDTTFIYSNLEISDSISIGNNANITNNLEVIGSVNILNGLKVFDSEFTTDYIQLNYPVTIKSNTIIEGDLTVNSGLTLNSSLSTFGLLCQGIASFTDDIFINGNLNYQNDLSLDFIKANNLSVTGNFLTNGISSFNSVFIEGETDIYNNLTVFSNLEVKENLTILGTTSINGSININSDLIIDGNLEVENQTIFNSNLTINNDCLILSKLNVNDNVIFGSNLIVTNSSEILGSLTISGDTLILNNLNVNGIANIDGDVNITGNTLLSSNMTINKDLEILGSLTVLGETRFNGETFYKDKNIPRGYLGGTSLVTNTTLTTPSDSLIFNNLTINDLIIGRKLKISTNISINNSNNSEVTYVYTISDNGSPSPTIHNSSKYSFGTFIGDKTISSFYIFTTTANIHTFDISISCANEITANEITILGSEHIVSLVVEDIGTS